MNLNKIIKNKIKFFRKSKNTLDNYRYISEIRTSEEFKQNRLISEIQRTVHQVEKGLSVEKPREGFGYEKISLIMDYLERLTETNREAEQVKNRAGSLIESYFHFYDEKGWKSEKLENLKDRFEKLNLYFVNNPVYGGLLEIQKVEHSEDEFKALQDIAKSRHSIRDFTGETVSVNDIRDAVVFAQNAPSACNRQSVRCYIIDNTMFEEIGEWIKNIGFFGDYGFDKILLVTAKITGYNENEGMQHLVSPGIFVGYLVLALEALNIGACIMQRSLNNDEKWSKARKQLNIPGDEQSFCLIGIGKKKDLYKVPVSLRLPIEVVLKEIKNRDCALF